MLKKGQQLVNEIYGNKNFTADKISINQLKELSEFVKKYLKEKGKNIKIEYRDEIMYGKNNKRLQVQGCFHGLQSKTLGNSIIEDSAGIRTENGEDNLENFSKTIIDFLEDLKNIKNLVKEKYISNGAYGGKNW